MKKINKLYLIYIPFMLIVLVILLLVNMYLPEVIEESPNKETPIYKSRFQYLGGTILLDYNELKKSSEEAGEVINNSSSITDVIEKLVKENDIKMYKEEDNKVLETNLSKKQAERVFGKYLDVKDELKIKVLFKPDENDTYAEDLHYQINKEEILRKKMVETAAAEVGKTGEDYWTWYGYNRRVEWCCVFVSWVAGQQGLIEEGIIPKFIWVKKGVDFFKERKQFKYKKEYVPKPGDIIFYNWGNENDIIDHVGIVEKVKDGYVYAIEGNVSYKWVKRKKYKLNCIHIYGYGIPDYNS